MGSWGKAGGRGGGGGESYRATSLRHLWLRGLVYIRSVATEVGVKVVGYYKLVNCKHMGKPSQGTGGVKRRTKEEEGGRDQSTASSIPEL